MLAQTLLEKVSNQTLDSMISISTEILKLTVRTAQLQDEEKALRLIEAAAHKQMQDAEMQMRCLKCSHDVAEAYRLQHIYHLHQYRACQREREHVERVRYGFICQRDELEAVETYRLACGR